MPCRDPYEPSFAEHAETKELLCALLRKMEGSRLLEGIVNEVPGLRKWWAIHKAEDALERAHRL